MPRKIIIIIIRIINVNDGVLNLIPFDNNVPSSCSHPKGAMELCLGKWEKSSGPLIHNMLSPRESYTFSAKTLNTGSNLTLT